MNKLLLVFVILFSVTIFACGSDDDTIVDGDQQDGDIITDGDHDSDLDTVDGDLEDGDVIDVDMPDGDQIDGDLPDGDVSDGDVTDGDASDGDVSDGDAPDGDVSDGDVVDGDLEDGDISDGDLPDGDQVDGDIEQDVEPQETTPPNIRDIRVTITGEFALETDLNREDGWVVVPVEVAGTITVFVTDNETAAADLSVKAIDADSSQEFGDVTKTFNNGLWRLALNLQPGMHLRVLVTDLANNDALSEYQLILPTQYEAIAGDWDKRYYLPGQIIDNHRYATFATDGSFQEDQEDTGNLITGTYELVDDKLKVSERTSTPSTRDTDTNTVERETVAAFYVDATYFSQDPFFRTDGSSGVVGSWQRSMQSYEIIGEQLTLARDVQETLVFTETRFTRTISGTSYESGSAESISEVYEGDWEIDINESYMDNYGDYLVLTTDTENSTPIASPVITADLYVIRADHLLIAPYLDNDID